MECVCEADEQKFKFVGSSLGVTGHHRLYKQVELEEPTARISIGSIVLVRYEPGREEKQNNALPLTRALCTVRAIWFCTRNKAAMIAVDFFWRFTDISDSSVLSSLQAIGAKYSDMCESHATNVEECDKMAVSCVLGVCTKVQSRILLPATTTTIHVCGRINDPTRAKPAVQTSKLYTYWVALANEPSSPSGDHAQEAEQPVPLTQHLDTLPHPPPTIDDSWRAQHKSDLSELGFDSSSSDDDHGSDSVRATGKSKRSLRQSGMRSGQKEQLGEQLNSLDIDRFSKIGEAHDRNDPDFVYLVSDSEELDDELDDGAMSEEASSSSETLLGNGTPIRSSSVSSADSTDASPTQFKLSVVEKDTKSVAVEPSSARSATQSHAHQRSGKSLATSSAKRKPHIKKLSTTVIKSSKTQQAGTTLSRSSTAATGTGTTSPAYPRTKGISATKSVKTYRTSTSAAPRPRLKGSTHGSKGKQSTPARKKVPWKAKGTSNSSGSTARRPTKRAAGAEGGPSTKVAKQKSAGKHGSSVPLQNPLAPTELRLRRQEAMTAAQAAARLVASWPPVSK
eukprot:m.140060 g.140060  ORF g.140060 m.140060 type:complete len:565 (+) comp14030_c1_seq2:216-1910(+)